MLVHKVMLTFGLLGCLVCGFYLIDKGATPVCPEKFRGGGDPVVTRRLDMCIFVRQKL